MINTLGVGGAENLLLRLVESLPRVAPVDSGICVLRPRLSFELEPPAGTSIWSLDYPGDYRRVEPTLRAVRRLRSIAREYRADIVHSYLWLSDFIAGLALGPGAARHLCHIVDRRPVQISRRPQDIVRRNLTRAVLRYSGAHFVAVSQAAMDFACAGFGWPVSRVRVAYNGVDVSEFTPGPSPARNSPTSRTGPPKPFVVGMLSRLVPEKGHAYLFRAAARLRSSGCDVRLRIAGTGPRLEEIASLAKESGVGECTDILGSVPSASDFYRTLDVLVQPSVRAEGLPTTILEAMASATPVVITDVGGGAEAVEDGVSGLVVPPADADALATALRRLSVDSDLRRALAEAGPDRVASKFTAKAMSQTVAGAYSDLLRGGRSRSDITGAERQAAESRG